VPTYKTQRVGDPVHGLIVFVDDGLEARRDQTAWRLLDTAEMQRLRRIRQLGVSEFTFPGATHSRFAHSLGVFNVARQLVRRLHQVLPDAEKHEGRADVAIFAALLHDLGHGPFSHAFERVQGERDAGKDHEDWTADIILDPSRRIRRILEDHGKGFAQQVADLLRAKNPEDAYHAIVSSSFDADRLDYLRRDKLMTGSGAGAIDYEWLLDNLVVGDVPIGSDDDPTSEVMRTFCLRRRALQAAESFLLGRYHLFEQVYLHKTTRGMETIVGKLLGRIADAAAAEESDKIGLDARDPLIAYFGSSGGSVERYLALDDTTVWAAASRMALSDDPEARSVARRLLDRERPLCLDIESAYPRRLDEDRSEAEARWRRQAERIDAEVRGQAGVVKDVVTFDAYGEIGEDKTRAHKRLAISVGTGAPQEITSLSDVIAALPRRELIRYYFDSIYARTRVTEAVG
jgi:HD superfamily phosphohydrolase